jgi:HD-GYP domain-containing protein (c-di-GMP phosphodiesterase class II)
MRMRGFAPLIPAVKYHHEQYDGSGYPEGLKSGAIPLSARIMGVADAFDAMTSDRPYRQGMSIDEAWAQLQVGAGSQFDPGVVTAFRRVLEKHDGDRL